MYMTAGQLAAHVSGMTWEDHVRKTVLLPLGMNSTNFSVADSQKSSDYSLPFTVAKDEIKQIPFRNIDQIGPAGSINSNVEDMIQYVKMHLAKGKGVLSPGIEAQMISPQMPISGPGADKELGASSYGMGFFLTSYRGHYLVNHGGNIDGFSALVSFLPQDNIGLVILTNQNASSLPAVVERNLYDRLLGPDIVDWTKRIKDQQAKAKASSEEAKKKGYTTRKTGTKPTHELADYAGEYEHPGYGVVKIDAADGGASLQFAFHGLGGPMNHFHYDVFEVAEKEQDPFSKAKVQFHTNLDGEIDSLSIPIEATVKEIVFTRLGDRKMTEPSFLRPLTGAYQRGPATVTVAMKGDHELTVTMPGQGAMLLKPVRGTKFEIKSMTGYSVEFKGDDLVFYQPNGTFVATRKK